MELHHISPTTFFSSFMMLIYLASA